MIPTSIQQKEIIQLLRALLDPTNPGFPGNPEIKLLLEGPARLYLATGVLPLLGLLERNNETACQPSATWCPNHHEPSIIDKAMATLPKRELRFH